jgi:hypothetical protein
MRYRLMASYLGVPYHVGLGPDGTEATLFSPGPPPDELGFTAIGGHWRKQVSISDLGALWQSRLVGEYHGEPCLVLDDLGDRLHIAYLGRDSAQARQLGYWEIDREVFEVVLPREDITGLTEKRVDFPLASAIFPPSSGQPGSGPFRAASQGPGILERTGPLRVTPRPAAPRAPDPAAPVPAASAPAAPVPAASVPSAPFPSAPGSAGAGPADRSPGTPDRAAAWHGSPEAEPWAAADPSSRPRIGVHPESQEYSRPDQRPDPQTDPRGNPPQPVSPPPRRARRDRVPESVFAELLRLAAIPQAAYAVDEEVPGAMCLVKTDGGFEVFSRTDDARLDVRFFEDEEAAYFYLFGVLAAEAVRSGRLRPERVNGHANGSRGPALPPTYRENVSKYLRGENLPNSPSGPAIVD